MVLSGAHRGAPRRPAPPAARGQARPRPEVFRARSALTRRGGHLTDTDRERPPTLLDAHPRPDAGRRALQDLHGLYTADDRQGALDTLGRFHDLNETGDPPEPHDIVDAFIN